MRRRRFKLTVSLEERLSEEAKRLREEAKSLQPGPQRETLLRNGKRGLVAATFNCESVACRSPGPAP